jgi:hypothetical protein
MGGMKRPFLSLLLVVVALPACKTAAPRAPMTGPTPLPGLLQPYVGGLRILAHAGDARATTLQPGQAATGTCDIAVRILRLDLQQETLRFRLETVGLPRTGERALGCKGLQPGMQLTLTGIGPGPVTPDVTARIDQVLLTPEAYLRTKGIAFDHPAAEATSDVASQLPDAGDDERRLARMVVAWPQPRLAIDCTYHDPSGRPGYERLVPFEALVGVDGKLRQPHVKGSPDPRYEAALEAALSLWRLEPARLRDRPVGARVALETVFRVY